MSAGSVYVMKLIIAPQNSLCNRNYAIFLYGRIVSNHSCMLFLYCKRNNIQFSLLYRKAECTMTGSS